jgi:hypothetical protein
MARKHEKMKVNGVDIAVDAPGFRTIKRKNGSREAYWYAPKKAVQDGYKPSVVRLHGNVDSESSLHAMFKRCRELWGQVRLWKENRGDRLPALSDPVMTAEDEKQPRKPREPSATRDMPLYPTEAQIARAVLGDRAKDWKRIAKVLEDKEGLPRINELMGGRFWPAVVAFFYGWQCVPIGGSIPENQAPSRFRIVPPKSKWED